MHIDISLREEVAALFVLVIYFRFKRFVTALVHT